MDIVKICKEYCSGCGLCQSELGAEMREGPKGYLYPVLQEDDKTKTFLKEVCPIADTHTEQKANSSHWGKVFKAEAAYSTDVVIRKKASSGGVLTALAIYLLESGKVDGVIQVCASKENPTETVCRISETKEQVIECCGSRYAISTPWLKLSEQLEQGKRYAAVGKPCDIAALRRLKKFDDKYHNILYLLSFFCAGLPSKEANKELLGRMGCEEKDCVSLCYRGNGWPGYATAVDRDGKEYKMEYSKAWGGILGRDVHPYCRLCIDGIGEAADIACGDGWYIKDNQPDFSERDGRNIVFVRNETGGRIYDEAIAAGVIVSEAWENLQQLQIIQKYQYTRKSTMRAKLLGYHICGRRTPVYDKKLLVTYAQKANYKQKAKIFLGTVKRILQRKI